MSKPMESPKRRPRRQFTEEFKASAVRLVLDEGKTVGAAARDLDLTETALREWVIPPHTVVLEGVHLTTSVPLQAEDSVRFREQQDLVESERASWILSVLDVQEFVRHVLPFRAS